MCISPSAVPLPTRAVLAAAALLLASDCEVRLLQEMVRSLQPAAADDASNTVRCLHSRQQPKSKHACHVLIMLLLSILGVFHTATLCQAVLMPADCNTLLCFSENQPCQVAAAHSLKLAQVEQHEGVDAGQLLLQHAAINLRPQVHPYEGAEALKLIQHAKTISTSSCRTQPRRRRPHVAAVVCGCLGATIPAMQGRCQLASSQDLTCAPICLAQ